MQEKAVAVPAKHSNAGQSGYVLGEMIMRKDELKSDIVFYSTPKGQVHIEVIYQAETFWLSQKRMAELFGVEVNTINYHLKEIFKSNELAGDTTIRKIRTVHELQLGNKSGRDSRAAACCPIATLITYAN